LAVNDLGNTGIQISVSGAQRGTEANVALSSLSGPSQGEAPVLVSGGDTRYYGVKLSGNLSQDSTASYCFTDPSFGASNQLAFWNGLGWVLLPSVASQNTVCAEALLREVGGTDFAVGVGFTPLTTSTKPSPSHFWETPAFAFLLLAVLVLTLLLTITQPSWGRKPSAFLT
jgi:hypothetical protein